MQADGIVRFEGLEPPVKMINLAFFCYPRKGALGDFAEVARRIRAAHPQIAAYAYATDVNLRAALGGVALAVRPTLTIEMDRIRFAPILRGRRLRHGGGHGKLPQMKALSEAGVPVPKWAELTPEATWSVAEWGPYVVVKPSRGGRGAYVWIRKTGRVRFKPQSDFPPDHPCARGPMIVQKFIYTGPWPTSYRVLTYFGRPLCALRYDGRRDLPALDDPNDFGGGGRSIVASAKGASMTCIDDADVLEIASRAHAAFADIPSLGIDIVREHETGKLYVLELNPGGNGWVLSGETGESVQKEFGLDFRAQFGALDIITEVSAELALKLAR
jgi:hypothetical protein